MREDDIMTSGRAFWVFVVACTVAIGAILAHSFLTYQAVARVAPPKSASKAAALQLSAANATTAKNGAVGAEPKALDTPNFVQASDAAEFMAPNDPVFLVEAPESALVLPVRVMEAYPVVNTSVGGLPATFTYCAQSQSGVGFWGSVDGLSTTFVPSRMLINRNMVLVDRATGSAWPQLLGMAAAGHLSGAVLRHVPMYPTTWQRVLREYPEALVLTGGPDGTVARTSDVVSSAPRFTESELGTMDTRLPVGEEVVGVVADDVAVAIPTQAVLVRHVVQFDCGAAKLVAIADSKLGIVRVFDRRLGGSGVLLDQVGGQIVDRTSRSVWDDRGRCVAGQLKGVALKPVESVDCDWFAWAAFFPTSEVYR